MSKVLGLDLGSCSLGWAILDDKNGDIIDKGVVVFPEGVFREMTSKRPPHFVVKNGWDVA